MNNTYKIKSLAHMVNLSYFSLMLPILLAQLLLRLTPVINNYFIGFLGHDALYLHNTQLNFITFGQFIGTATTISILVFWRRKECIQQQGNVFIKHILATLFLTSTIAIVAWHFSDNILAAYKINKSTFSVAKTYLGIGLINMILQSVYVSLDGMLVASKQQKYSLYIATGVIILNIAIDALCVSHFYPSSSITTPLFGIIFTTTISLLLAIGISTNQILHHIQGWSPFKFKDMLSVWSGELSVYLIRGVTPFVYTYQLCLITATAGFLITYQLALQLSYLFCLPLIASMQIAVREASEAESATDHSSDWYQPLLYAGILPTTILFTLGIVMAKPILKIAFNYYPPSDHIPYLPIYFIACWIGQWGNIFTIPLRAKKLNYLVAKNFFIAELLILLGGTQLLILLNLATPQTVAYASLLFSATFLILNLRNMRMANQTNLEMAS